MVVETNPTSRPYVATVTMAPRYPGLRDQLRTAHHQTADFLLEVDLPVRVAHDGQVGRHPFNWLGNYVEVLTGMNGDGNSVPAAELVRPYAGADHHNLAGDRPGVRRLELGNVGSWAILIPLFKSFAPRRRSFGRPGGAWRHVRPGRGQGHHSSGVPGSWLRRRKFPALAPTPSSIRLCATPA